MALSPFAIATQGVGPDPLLTAVQGFYESTSARQQLLDDFLYGGGDGRTDNVRTPQRPIIPPLGKARGTVAFGSAYGILSAAPPFVAALERHAAAVNPSAAHGTFVTAEVLVHAKDWRDDDGIIAVLSSLFD